MNTKSSSSNALKLLTVNTETRCFVFKLYVNLPTE